MTIQLNSNISQSNYDTLCSYKILYKNNYQQTITYERLGSHLISVWENSKKAIVNSLEALEKSSLNELFPFLVTQLLNKLNNKNSSNNFYFYLSNEKCLTILSHLKELEHNKKISFTIDFDKKELSDMYEKHISTSNIQLYLSLYEQGLVDKISDLNKKINIEYLSATKLSLNILIDLFCFEKKELYLTKLKEIFHLVRSSDPELSGIKIKTLLKEIELPDYSEELKSSIKDLILINKNDFIREFTNTFSLDLDIDKITLLQKAKGQKNNDLGSYFIIKMDEVLLKAKEEGILFCDSYFDRKEEKEKIKHHSRHKNGLSQRSMAEALKRFDFFSSDKEDQEKKLRMFKTFFLAAINISSSEKTSVFVDILKKVSLKEHLDTELDDIIETKPKRTKL